MAAALVESLGLSTVIEYRFNELDSLGAGAKSDKQRETMRSERLQHELEALCEYLSYLWHTPCPGQPVRHVAHGKEVLNTLHRIKRGAYDDDLAGWSADQIEKLEDRRAKALDWVHDLLEHAHPAWQTLRPAACAAARAAFDAVPSIRKPHVVAVTAITLALHGVALSEFVAQPGSAAANLSVFARVAAMCRAEAAAQPAWS
jgi:hypothetical protein